MKLSRLALAPIIFSRYLIKYTVSRNQGLPFVLFSTVLIFYIYALADMVLITLVNLYLCENNFKENEEDLRYYNLMFLFVNWLWVSIFFCDEFFEIIRWLF